jgi:type I restriction enzyme M protein
MTDVVKTLWGYAGALRHDGVDYGDYIEQLTYLLFLKMADEQAVELPEKADWPHLRKQSGTVLVKDYQNALEMLGEEPGILGDIFAGAVNRLTQPVTLSRLIKAIDGTEWMGLDVDVKAAAFEGLLEKSAAEGKKGAGQYFTPRPLIRSMVRLTKPDPRGHRDFSVMDPACGTGGFLVAAYEWLLGETKGAMDRKLAKQVRTQTYFGQELVPRPRRLALMNMYLHQVEPHILIGDSIYEAPSDTRFDVVLTNPPFGNKGASQAPTRDDFTVETANKQLNFLQHVLTILKPGGRAAVVVPDNVLFADKAGEVFKILMEDADVHTLLRCPRGTFNPYTDGTKTNVLFLTKGIPTERTWIYDARSNIPKVTKVSRPLTPKHFEEFERCFGDDPFGRAKRKEQDSEAGRWRPFEIVEIRGRDYKLENLKWIRDEELDDPDELPDPEDLIGDVVSELQLAIADLQSIQKLLKVGGGTDE